MFLWANRRVFVYNPRWRLGKLKGPTKNPATCCLMRASLPVEKSCHTKQQDRGQRAKYKQPFARPVFGVSFLRTIFPLPTARLLLLRLKNYTILLDKTPLTVESTLAISRLQIVHFDSITLPDGINIHSKILVSLRLRL